MKKVLILSNSDMIFHKELEENLIEKNIKVRRIVINNLCVLNNKFIIKYKFASKIISILKWLKAFFLLLLADADVINLHYVDAKSSLILYFLSFFTKKKIILNFYGSDFYRKNDSYKLKLEKTINKAYRIIFTNGVTKDEFDSFFNYKYSNKLFVIRFGLKNLEVIKEMMGSYEKSQLKEQIGISPEKIVVTCGYGSIQEHQHEKIIEQLDKLDGNIRNKCLFLFPMTYGTGKELRIKKVNNTLSKSNLEYKILDQYLEGKDLGSVRLCTDIMINLQTTDQLSGSMQEHIYAGNYIIAGGWLPYDIFIELGINSMFRIASFAELNKKLIDLILKIEEEHYQNGNEINQEIIWKLSSWEANINKWIDSFN